MKNIVLLASAVIAGAVRYPVEGPIPVSDEIADGLVSGGQAEFADLGEEGGDDLDSQTVAALKAIAVAEEIDLGEATKKADIIAKIRAHRGAGAEE